MDFSKHSEHRFKSYSEDFHDFTSHIDTTIFRLKELVFLCCFVANQGMEALFAIDSLEDFENATEEIIANLYSPETSSETLKAAKHELKHLFTTNNFKINKVIDAVHRTGGETEKINYFINKLTDHKVEILYAALVDYNTLHGECVKDFDWTVKLILGTSALKSLRYPVLQLALSSVNANGSHRNIVYEMKKDVLSKLINALENVK